MKRSIIKNYKLQVQSDIFGSYGEGTYYPPESDFEKCFQNYNKEQNKTF